MKTKFIFITGGVVSSLGKGICGASIATLLKAHNYKTRIRKLDPYLNVDPGTMNPKQHGEVFVTEDGAETDLDLGHYERFLDENTKKTDNITAGQIYSNLLKKERRGDYLGGTVQVIPHITDLIKEFIYSDITDEDFIIYEIGGTVGDIEGLPFFEAIRQVGNEMDRENALFIHLTLLPYIKSAKELKTKPTQHSVKELRSIGIQPNILVCRSEKPILQSDREKIALFCNLAKENVISALDAKSIYQVPLLLREEYIDRRIFKHFAIEKYPTIKIDDWLDINKKIKNLTKEVTIAIIGKYIELEEAYKSIIESLNHSGFALDVKIKIKWINAKTLTTPEKIFDDVNAILVPGGFGSDGMSGKMLAIKYARENNIVFLGICLGMQLAILEFAKNVAKLNNPYSSEQGEQEGSKLIGLMREWSHKGKKKKRDKQVDLGGTMRLGSYPCVLTDGSYAEKIYGQKNIFERHRHRYEVNISYKEKLEQAGLVFSGLSPDKNLVEIVELKEHRFFIACQFHPEFKTRLFNAPKLFLEFVQKAVNS